MKNQKIKETLNLTLGDLSRKRVKISVIVVNFNTFKFLDKCLKSIYEGDFPLKFLEIIVADNNSRDNSPDLIRKNHKRVRLIENKINYGFSKANNIAVRKARGEFILFLNPDTVLKGNTLSVMYQFMKNNNGVGAATCKLILPSGRIDDACHRGFPTPWNAFCHFSKISELFPRSVLLNGYHLGYRAQDKIHEIDALAGAFMLVGRDVGNKLKWFDEDYFWYGEDIDFCYRIKAAGYKIMFVPQVTAIHYKGVSSGIKKHSKNLSSATRETKIKAVNQRYIVMRTFYEKHYQKKYPLLLRKSVFFAIRFKEMVDRIKL